ncbi:MAG: NAD(P)-dependent oxidoreductase [Myxococcota bacterium]
MSHDRALSAEQEIGRINSFFPILPRLGNRWAASRPWEGHRIALNLHITTLTACFVREATLGGGQFLLSAANPRTTDPGSVELIRSLGCEVYTGGDLQDRHIQVLDHKPTFVVDVGFELMDTLLDKRRDHVANVKAGIEITRGGTARLRARGPVPFPVVNINDGRLKDKVENRHGVGEAIWQAVAMSTGMHLAGRRVLVVGYGPVGRGLATYAKAAGMAVEVCEEDPVRRLFAHYDGYPTPALEEAVGRVGIVVTATGRQDALTVGQLERARDGLVLLNAGQGGREIDVDGIRRAAVKRDDVADQVARYQLENGRSITVLGDGHPLNIVLNSGSPEPVLLHFAVLGLTLEWLASGPQLRPGEVLVTDDIENRAALLALDALQTTGG